MAFQQDVGDFRRRRKSPHLQMLLTFSIFQMRGIKAIQMSCQPTKKGPNKAMTHSCFALLSPQNEKWTKMACYQSDIKICTIIFCQRSTMIATMLFTWFEGFFLGRLGPGPNCPMPNCPGSNLPRTVRGSSKDQT